jgi:hypothetical protein
MAAVACRCPIWQQGARAWEACYVSELESLITEWLPLPDVAERLGLPIKKVHSLLEERALVAARVGERSIRSVPADFLLEDRLMDSLKGTVSVLSDAGYNDEEILRWLFTEDDSLPGRPVDALRQGRKTEIRRRAQALGW